MDSRDHGNAQPVPLPGLGALLGRTIRRAGEAIFQQA